MPGSYLGAPGAVKGLHQVHSLFGADRAIDGGVSQAMLPEVARYNLQHAGPLGDHDTGRKENTKRQPPEQMMRTRKGLLSPAGQRHMLRSHFKVRMLPVVFRIQGVIRLMLNEVTIKWWPA